MVVRKRSAPSSDDNSKDAAAASPSPKKPSTSQSATSCDASDATANDDECIANSDNGALECIAILPGIGKYTESSDSDKSTDTEEDYDFSSYDWIGRKIKKHTACE